MAKGDDIQERLIDFAVESIRLSATLNGSTGVWLEIIRRSGMATTQELAAIGAECDELSRIIGASIRTVNRRNSKSTRDRSD